MKVPIFFHDSSLRHDTGAHPERAERVAVSLAHLRSLPGGIDLRVPRPAKESEIALVHAAGYVGAIREFAEAGGGYLDPDTALSRDSYDAALHAAGAVLTAIDAVLDGPEEAAFALVRPPGHHARPGAGMGFCLFNNVAIGARYLVEERGLSRVAIVDWDVHHGNGTQEALYEDGSIFYLSLHRYPFYPGTGLPQERGEGPGAGTTLNVPLGASTPASEYLRIFGEAVGEVAAFGPEFVLVSAGFDAYRNDPIGGLNLGVDDYATLAARLRDAFPEARGFVSALEGGYDLEGLPRCIAAHLTGLTA